ncbi:DUF4306 domain-containing protein [Rossellomorea aquimaris]|nr:DUF4306 domain-containing protein [Rossellomorea aquimaris]
MKKWWTLWFLSIPILLISFVFSFFTDSKIVYWSQQDCKPEFIFTPQSVKYCSDIYAIDVLLISLRDNPISYICLTSGLYLIGFIFYQKVLNNRQWFRGK